MINGKQIIQDTIDWVKVKASSLPSQITALINGNALLIKEVEDSQTLVLGADRYNTVVTHYSITSNILTLIYKEPTFPIASNAIIKSPTLGFPDFTPLLVASDAVFPLYVTSYEKRFNLTRADVPLTAINDIEFITGGEYLNSLVIVSAERTGGNLVTFTTQSPYMFGLTTVITDTEIECPQLGLYASAIVTYTITAVTATTFTIVSSGINILVPNPIINFYSGLAQTQKSKNGTVSIFAPIERYTYGGSFGRALNIECMVDYSKGLNGFDGTTVNIQHIDDPTGEFLIPGSGYRLSMNNCNYVTRRNRPRLVASSIINAYQGALNGNIGATDTIFNNSSSAGYIQKVLCINRHNTVSITSNIATINTTLPHGVSVGDTVTVVSTVIGSFTAVVSTVSSLTITLPRVATDVPLQTDSVGYFTRSGTSHIVSVERLTSGSTKIVKITTNVAHGIAVNSYILVNSAVLGYVNSPRIAQAVTTSSPFTISFIDTVGVDVVSTLETSGSVRTSMKNMTLTSNKHRAYHTLGWFMAGLEYTGFNSETDNHFFDRNFVGFYSNAPAGTVPNPNWNFYVPSSSLAPSKFSRTNYFGTNLPAIAPPIDVNGSFAGAISLGNTTTSTPTDGIVSKLTNSDLNYVANTTWRGLLYVTGGTGANTAITTTANTILKTNGTLGLVNSVLTDNGTILKYNTQSVQRVATVTTTVSNITAGNLGHSYTQSASTTEVGSSITFETMLVKNADTALSVQISAVSNTALTESNGTPLLGSDYNLALLNGSIYKFVVTMVRTSSTNWKATTTLLATSSLGVADEVLLSYVGSFTNNITETLAIGLQFRAGTSSTADNVMSLIKIS